MSLFLNCNFSAFFYVFSRFIPTCLCLHHFLSPPPSLSFSLFYTHSLHFSLARTTASLSLRLIFPVFFSLRIAIFVSSSLSPDLFPFANHLCAFLLLTLSVSVWISLSLSFFLSLSLSVSLSLSILPNPIVLSSASLSLCLIRPTVFIAKP